MGRARRNRLRDSYLSRGPRSSANHRQGKTARFPCGAPPERGPRGKAGPVSPSEQAPERSVAGIRARTPPEEVRRSRPANGRSKPRSEIQQQHGNSQHPELLRGTGTDRIWRWMLPEETWRRTLHAPNRGRPERQGGRRAIRRPTRRHSLTRIERRDWPTATCGEIDLNRSIVACNPAVLNLGFVGADGRFGGLGACGRSPERADRFESTPCQADRRPFRRSAMADLACGRASRRVPDSFYRRRPRDRRVLPQAPRPRARFLGS